MDEASLPSATCLQSSLASLAHLLDHPDVQVGEEIIIIYVFVYVYVYVGGVFEGGGRDGEGRDGGVGKEEGGKGGRGRGEREKRSVGRDGGGGAGEGAIQAFRGTAANEEATSQIEGS